jgi:hypothetical protein
VRPKREDLAGAAEIRNSALAVAYLPVRYKTRRKAASQSSADWIANVAYWATYPEAPVKIAKGDRQWANVWLRVRGIVGRMLDRRKGLPLANPVSGSDPAAADSRSWQVLALIVGETSTLRVPSELAARYRDAAAWMGGEGKGWVERWRGTDLGGGVKVTDSGLVVEVMLRTDRSKIDEWATKPTRAFFAGNGVF